MTRDEAREMAALLVEFADGRDIQFDAVGDGHWQSLEKYRVTLSKYRRKPKPRECWRAAYRDGEGFHTPFAYPTREKCAEDCRATARPVRFVEAQDE